jgi:hypothetical protein
MWAPLKTYCATQLTEWTLSHSECCAVLGILMYVVYNGRTLCVRMVPLLRAPCIWAARDGF